MAIAVGNKTQTTASFTENGNSRVTLSHNQNAGTDKWLLVAVTITSVSGIPNFTSLTYNGVALTQVVNYFSSTAGHRWAVFALEDPDDGTNNLEINLSSPTGNPGSISITSLTGCAGIGNTGNNDFQSTPHNRNITISENSLIYAFSVGYQPPTGISIAGSSRTLEFTHNVNRFVGAAFSEAGLGAGSYQVSNTTAFSQLSNTRIELLESGGGGGGDAAGSWLMIL